jgi:hypothetical protein
LSRYVTLGEVIVDQFTVWADDGYNKVSGETSFYSTLWIEGVPSAIPVIIVEIGASGEYRASFTPDVVGSWILEIKIPSNLDVWGGEYKVVRGKEEDIEIRFSIADDGNEITMLCWTEIDGQRSLIATSCSARIIGEAGEVKDLGTNNSPDVNGAFSFVTDSDLDPHTPYYVAIQMTDGTRSWYANKGFATG